jgi:hypothetical protein
MADDGAGGSAEQMLTLTANQLRQLAEQADGQRGVELELGDMIRQPDGSTTPSLRPAGTGGDGARSIRILTPLLASNRRLPAAVTLTSPTSGKLISIDPKRYDALFWGEAAMEKFLIPYYARFNDERQLAALRSAIANDAILALSHLYPTFWEEIPDE